MDAPLPITDIDATELYSHEWYRVANLKLRLRPGMSVSRQVVRGLVWHVLTDPYTGRQHRFNESAWRLLAAMDGERTLDQIWRDQLARHGDDAATQPEALRVVTHAYAGQLLIGQVQGDARALVKAQRRGQRQRTRAAANPLAFRLPLWNPDAALSAWAPRLGWLLGRTALRIGWALAALGLVLLLWHGDAIAREAATHTGSMRLLLAMWLVWPLMKGLHELGHALLIKHLGGEVNEIGVTLMMLTPLPYVDATASSAFADKRDRAAVAAAGILVEAVLATLALLGWLALEPGLLREICLATVLVGGISTLLVNGNPLMRYDGYHVAVDLLELPNLAPRSVRWWNLLLQRRLLGERRARMEDLSQGEEKWLALYAPLSWLWRVVLMASLALGLSRYSQLLALVLLAMAAWAALLGPLWKALRWTSRAPEAAGHRVRAGAVLGAAGVLGLAMLFGVPVADRTHAPGVVWLPDEAFVRLQVDARLERFLVEDGALVQAGTPIAQARNEDLMSDLGRAREALRSAQVERLTRFDNDAARTAVAEDQLQRLQAEVDRLQGQADQLTLRSAVAGRVVLTPPPRVLGRWLPQGETLAQVLPPGAARVRALVRNEAIGRVRAEPGEVAVTLAQRADESLPAVVERLVPRATRELPSAALGEPAGGPVRVDPADPQGRTAAEPRFVVDLRLPEGIEARVGTRAMVSFEHGHTVAADLLVRTARELLLRHFER